MRQNLLLVLGCSLALAASLEVSSLEEEVVPAKTGSVAAKKPTSPTLKKAAQTSTLAQVNKPVPSKIAGKTVAKPAAVENPAQPVKSSPGVSSKEYQQRRKKHDHQRLGEGAGPTQEIPMDEKMDDATYEKWQYAKYQGHAMQEADVMVQRILRAQRMQKQRDVGEMSESHDAENDDENDDEMMPNDDHSDEQDKHQDENDDDRDENDEDRDESDEHQDEDDQKSDYGEDKRTSKETQDDSRTTSADREAEILRADDDGKNDDQDTDDKDQDMDDDDMSDSDENDLGESQSIIPSRVGESALGKSNAQAKEAFSAIHVPHSGDIEDHDSHFVMTNDLRHAELKEALMDASETHDETLSSNEANKMKHEQEKIAQFRAKQAAKDAHDEQQRHLNDEVKEQLREHDLMLDKKGRVVPDVY